MTSISSFWRSSNEIIRLTKLRGAALPVTLLLPFIIYKYIYIYICIIYIYTYTYYDTWILSYIHITQSVLYIGYHILHCYYLCCCIYWLPIGCLLLPIELQPFIIDWLQMFDMYSFATRVSPLLPWTIAPTTVAQDLLNAPGSPLQSARPEALQWMNAAASSFHLSSTPFKVRATNNREYQK